MKLLHFVMVLLLAFSTAPSIAIANDLTLGQALEKALQGNPELQKYPYQKRMAEAQRLQASLRPNPVVGVELENIAGTGRNKGVDSLQATLSFSQLIELGDKRDQRVALASAEQKRTDAEFNYSKIAVLAETAQRFYKLVQLKAIAAWNKQQQQRLNSALKTARERVDAGAVPASEVTRIRLQQGQLKAEGAALQGKYQEAKSMLSAMWAAEPKFTGIIGEFDARQDIPSRADIETAVNQAPEFLRLLDSERILNAKAESVKAAATSDLTLGMGVRYNNEFNDSGLVLQASMPLQLTNPSQGDIESNQIAQNLLLEQQRIIRSELRVQANALLTRIKVNQTYLDNIERDLLPLARQLQEETEAGYKKGIHNLLMVLDAQSELAQLEYQQINRRHAIYQDILELERMTGQPITGSE